MATNQKRMTFRCPTCGESWEALMSEGGIGVAPPDGEVTCGKCVAGTAEGRLTYLTAKVRSIEVAGKIVSVAIPSPMNANPSEWGAAVLGVGTAAAMLVMGVDKCVGRTAAVKAASLLLAEMSSTLAENLPGIKLNVTIIEDDLKI